MPVVNDPRSTTAPTYGLHAILTSPISKSKQGKSGCATSAASLSLAGASSSATLASASRKLTFEHDGLADEAPDVEVQVSAKQSPRIPQGLKSAKPVKWKRSRKQKSCHIRAYEKKAIKKDAGARLMFNKASMAKVGRNERTCLPDAVAALLPTNTKELVHAAMVKCMPEEGDTSILQLSTALARHRLSLLRVSRKYNRKGGFPHQLLKEKDCQLIVHIRLTDLNANVMSHFVAWDGNVIIDHPKSSKVNDATDRTDPKKSKLAFGKLYPPTEFISWQITSVYQIIQGK
jgi:hypothetical protein